MFIDYRCLSEQNSWGRSNSHQFPVENRFQAYYWRVCWTENCPIFSQAFTATAAIDFMELEVERSTNH